MDIFMQGIFSYFCTNYTNIIFLSFQESDEVHTQQP